MVSIVHTSKFNPDGTTNVKPSAFRSWISNEPGAKFAPEADRYVLFISYPCPFAHRANIVRVLKGLEDIIPAVVLDWELFAEGGWSFTGRDGTALDTLYGFKHLKDFYFKANPDYVGRYTVPTLWDKKLETIVSNESSEIIRMFYSAFDELLPAPLREVNKPHGGLLPPHLKEKIDEMNEWVYSDLTTGVYKAGFASTQAMYEENVLKVFKALDKVEKILGESEGKYVFGDSLTEADIRLYPTIVRFDVAYFSLFQCNLRMIRFAYPRVQKWLMGLYYSEEEDIRGVFGAKTTCFDHIKKGYTGAAGRKLVPLGPDFDMLPKDTKQ